jgi:hypothetical protein
MSNFKQNITGFIKGVTGKVFDKAKTASDATMQKNIQADDKCTCVTRKASTNCCPMCTDLAGTYDKKTAKHEGAYNFHSKDRCNVVPVFENKNAKHNNTEQNRTSNEIIEKDFKVLYLNGKETRFIKDSSIIVKKNFAGKGSEPFRELRKRFVLAEKYGGEPDDWMHLAGNGWIFDPISEKIGHAEIHWMQNDVIGRYEEFVFKSWLKK